MDYVFELGVILYIVSLGRLHLELC